MRKEILLGLVVLMTMVTFANAQISLASVQSAETAAKTSAQKMATVKALSPAEKLKMIKAILKGSFAETELKGGVTLSQSKPTGPLDTRIMFYHPLRVFPYFNNVDFGPKTSSNSSHPQITLSAPKRAHYLFDFICNCDQAQTLTFSSTDNGNLGTTPCNKTGHYIFVTPEIAAGHNVFFLSSDKDWTFSSVEITELK